MRGRLPEEGGVLSDTFVGKILFGDRSKEDHKGGGFIVSHFSQKTREMGHPTLFHPAFPELLADAELSNDRLIALGIVSLEVVQ